MSQRGKSVSSEPPPCEKYLNKILRQETISGNKRFPNLRQFQEKFSHLSQFSKPQPQQKNRLRSTSVVSSAPSPSTPLKAKEGSEKEAVKVFKPPPPSTFKSRQKSSSTSANKESWGALLKTSRSKEKVSTFSNFDPLRTLHFLSKELNTKLQNTIPGEQEILQMVIDIQYALKRIPPEVSTFMHNPQIEYPQSESSYSAKTTSNRSVQTPPTLYQEDTEKFQKIMEENTMKLEESCKQLEMVCTNLQNEKDMTEKELDEARENMEMLCRRVKELEVEVNTNSVTKIQQLLAEKQMLEEELVKASEEVNNSPTIIHLRNVIEDLRRQKNDSEERYSRLEYDMTLLKMEKEKFVTMLGVRDKELNDIQEEMARIQDSVKVQLKKLNLEVLERTNSIKNLDPFNAGENIYLDIGDTTLSSVASNESDHESVGKEAPCGDAKCSQKGKQPAENSENRNLLNRLKANSIQLNLNENGNQREDIFDELLTGLTPSMKKLLDPHQI